MDKVVNLGGNFSIHTNVSILKWCKFAYIYLDIHLGQEAIYFLYRHKTLVCDHHPNGTAIHLWDQQFADHIELPITQIDFYWLLLN